MRRSAKLRFLLGSEVIGADSVQLLRELLFAMNYLLLRRGIISILSLLIVVQLENETGTQGSNDCCCSLFDFFVSLSSYTVYRGVLLVSLADTPTFQPTVWPRVAVQRQTSVTVSPDVHVLKSNCFPWLT